MSQHFLQAAVPWATANDKARIITMTSSSAWGVWPFLAAYAMSKLANIPVHQHPGRCVSRDTACYLSKPRYETTQTYSQLPFRAAGLNCNDPSLAGGNIVWLVADPARSEFLNGRVLTAEWDVDELVARKEEIMSKNLLTMQLQATLGFGAV